MSVTPNPTSEQSEIMVEITRDSRYTISVMDINGKKINTIVDNKNLLKGTYRYPVIIEQKGLIFINCIDKDGNISVKKLLKI